MSLKSLSSALKEDRWVFPFFKKYKKSLLIALLLGVLTFILASALMVTSGYLISGSAERPYHIFVLHLPLLLIRFFGVGKPISYYLERLTSHDWVLRMTSGLRLKLYESVEKDAITLKGSRKTGDILGLLTDDLGHIQNTYLRTVFPAVVAIILYALILTVVGVFNIWVALLLFLLLAMVIVLLPLASLAVDGVRKARQKQDKNLLYTELTDNVLGISDWVFSQRGSEYLTSHNKLQSDLRSSEHQSSAFMRRQNLIGQFIYGVIIIVLLIWAVTDFGGQWGGTANWIAAIVLGFFPLIDAFTPLPEAFSESRAHADSIKRLNDLPEQTVVEKDGAVQKPSSTEIDVSHVWYRYPGTERDILSDLSISILEGQKLAILGRSGSGKSTLSKLIRGDLAPQKGSVTLGGVPTIDFGDDISQYISVIQQQTYLFNATLLDNLRIGNANATEEEAWRVLEMVGLKELAERLPDKLHTMVDEAGKRFSGGERHRIALARVLLGNAPIVILDEPTVGLDPLTERKLLTTIFETLKDKTLIMITHHLQGVEHMDRVVFISEGGIKLYGSPAELQKTSDYFKRLQEFDKGVSLDEMG